MIHVLLHCYINININIIINCNILICIFFEKIGVKTLLNFRIAEYKTTKGHSPMNHQGLQKNKDEILIPQPDFHLQQESSPNPDKAHKAIAPTHQSFDHQYPLMPTLPDNQQPYSIPLEYG